MVTVHNTGAYLLGGNDWIPDGADAAAIVRQKTGSEPDRAAARRATMAYRILSEHNTAQDMDKLRIRFDALASHDITYVGIIQTARASGLTEFPSPTCSPTATIPCARWAAPSMRTTICSGSRPPKVRRDLRAAAPGRNPPVHARAHERLREDDPRLGQPHPLRRAWRHGRRRGRPGACQAAAAPHLATSTCRKSSACT